MPALSKPLRDHFSFVMQGVGFVVPIFAARDGGAATDAWIIGYLALGGDSVRELPDKKKLVVERRKRWNVAGSEVTVFERSGDTTICYHALDRR